MDDNSRLSCSIAICKELNAAPYLSGVYGISLGHRDCVSCDFTCGLVSLPDQWPWSLVWKWDYVCTCVHLKIESYGTDSSQAVLWTALSREAMKILSGRIALHCDKHQFCDKVMVSTWTVLKLLLLEHSGCNKEHICGEVIQCLFRYCMYCVSAPCLHRQSTN